MIYCSPETYELLVLFFEEYGDDITKYVYPYVNTYQQEGNTCVTPTTEKTTS